jgi:hypothetical protein
VFDDSKRNILKRMPGWNSVPGAVIIRTQVVIVLNMGIVRLIERTALAATGINYNGLTANDIGAADLINAAGNVALATANRLTQSTFPAAIAAQGRVALAYLTLALGPGVPSWERGFGLLDPAGLLNIVNGHNTLNALIGQAVSRVLALGLAEATYEFTRIVDINNQLPNDPQAVAMTLFVEIYHT